MTLCRTERQPAELAAHDGFGRPIAGDDALFQEPRDERVRVLERRILPYGSAEPERSSRRLRQRDVIVIPKAPGKKLRQKGARLESNTEPFAIGRTVQRRHPGLGTP